LSFPSWASETEFFLRNSYAVKSTYALALLEPYIGEGVPDPSLPSQPPRFEDMVAKVEQSVVLVLIY